MATSSTSTFPQKKNRHTFSIVSSLLLLLFIFCFFFFTKTTFEPKLSLYTNLVSQIPSSLTQIHENFDDSKQPEFQEETNGETSLPIISKSDLDDGTSQETSVPVIISSKHEFQEEFEEPISSDEKTNVPILSESDLDQRTSSETSVPIIISSENESQDGTKETFEESIISKSDLDHRNRNRQKTSMPTITESEPQDGTNEIFEDPISSNEITNVPISSKSDLDEETSEKPTVFDVKEKPFEDSNINVIVEKLKNCNIYKGKWVEDEDYPLYKPGTCPYVDEAFDCQNNGRPDSGYTKWRWKPDECDLPRFNATDFLVRLRRKRLMLVGDSMNRNQFESLLCLLREALPDKSKMYETHGYKITKGRGYFIFKFEDYDCSVEFVRSHFLVREGVRINARGNSNPILSIDRIDKTAKRWKRADILVFNTGHWWTHGKTSRGKNYYKEGNYIYPRFDPVEAYRRSIKTWAKWIDRNVRNEKLVFYRGYSSAHFRGGDWDSGGTCNGETDPVTRGAILDSYPIKMTIVDEVIKEMHMPVVLLNVTHLTNYRKDGHPSIYRKNATTSGRRVSTRRQDCSHWCLPGVPDAWNELIYANLVAKKT